MEQQNNSNKQRKLMPVELLVDMIKTSISLNGVKMASKHLRTNINGRTPFQISGLKSLDDLKKRLYQLVINIKMEKNVLKKYWHKFARNILTSSGIVYSLVGENFKNMKKTIMDTNKEKESQEALREAVGPDTNIIAGFVKGLVDSDARQLLIKILHHMENQNEVNNEMRKCLTDMKGLLNKQSFLLARQANSGSMMVAELRTFLNMPNKEESDSVKMALKRTKSYPPGKMLKCDFCDREYDVKHYERHLLTRKHLQAVEGKKRKIDCEQMEQEHGEDTGAGPSTSSAFAPK